MRKKPQILEGINQDDKFFPEANEWMWDYCTFLGKFTDSKGVNYDLGIVMEHGECLNATVYGNEAGNYNSLNFTCHMHADEDREHILECYKRAKQYKFIK